MIGKSWASFRNRTVAERSSRPDVRREAIKSYTLYARIDPHQIRFLRKS